MQIKTLDFFKLPEGLRVPFLSGRIYNFISKLERKQIRKLSIDKLSLNDSPREKKIVVSLTSFPARIDCVGYAIKSLFNQTVKPDRIVLWLATEQFKNRELPELLEKLKEKRLEIRFCEDLKSHKKYYFALQEQRPDELVITYDDDLIYPENSIERLVNLHKKYPDCIITNRAQAAAVENGEFLPYSKWKVRSSIGVRMPSSILFSSTGGGTLYPYNSVNEEAFNVEKMKEIAFSADDLWMRFMSALNGTQIVKTVKNHKTFTVIDGSQTESLQVENCIGGANDEALNLLKQNYPEAFENIFSRNVVK